MEDVIIIGAGLSGLASAYFLKKNNISYKVLEAQNRLGGRIETVYGKKNTPMEMGATWFGQQHHNLLSFIHELGIDFFKQHDEGIALFETMSFEPPQQYYVPEAATPVYRIKDGTSAIINKLKVIIGDSNIILQHDVISVIDLGNHLKIICENGNEYLCKMLVFAVPPKVINSRVKFHPELPTSLTKMMSQVQTWMSGSIKFSVEYASPFWRNNGFSGSVYSQSGFAPEIYDHTNFEKSKFAIKGFLNGSAVNFNYEERQQKVIAQLVKYWGEEANNFISYNDKIWDDKFIKSTNDGFLPPHYNNGHMAFSQSYMNQKLFITSTETSNVFGGYMDGAINSARTTSQNVLELLGAVAAV